VAAVVFLTTGAVLASLQSLLLTVLSAVILLVAVAPFLLPTHYTLTDEGVHERRFLRRKARAWRDLRRVQIGPRAALVSPFARPSWMDRYRGLVIWFDGADRDQVIALLRSRVAASAKDRPEPSERAEP
jgi:hypothetical protein